MTKQQKCAHDRNAWSDQLRTRLAEFKTTLASWPLNQKWIEDCVQELESITAHSIELAAVEAESTLGGKS